MNRRLMVAAGAAALVAGAGTAWYRYRPGPVLSGAESVFWGASLQDLGGNPVALSAMKGRPVLVNFWATWCPPCVEELPLINRFYQSQKDKGWTVLGIAVDKVDAVRPFLARTPLDFPVLIAGFAGSDLGRQLGNDAGGLPFSVLFGAEGQVLDRQIGQLHEKDLVRWASLIE